MQWNLCITDSKKYSFISTNIIFFLRGISVLFADVAVYADVAHIELLAHNQLSPSIHLASQSSFDTHNQAYGLKCNRKSRVPKWIIQTNEDMKAKIAESSKFSVL